jgi:hypothetical protein
MDTENKSNFRITFSAEVTIRSYNESNEKAALIGLTPDYWNDKSS